MKRKIIPGTIPTADLHQYLLGSVAPRPIAFVSTMDAQGRTNLAPYSFFNAFSSNPPILVFSSNRRVEGNTTKDTLHNIMESKECVVNVVNYEIVRQMMICSVDFPTEISEFEQSGLTPVPAELVKCPLVKESPVNMECVVQEIIPLGDQGGAGHLIICKVVCMHVSESVLDENSRIDPQKIDLMGRMGRAFYVRASGKSVLTMPQSQHLPIVGYPNLPEHIRLSTLLTANDIAYLAGLKALPDPKTALDELLNDADFNKAFQDNDQKTSIHKLARQYFELGNSEKAAKILACI
ncbi:MAG: flavin reductase family protein [Saprospiraceae bacterium]|nr:flavin reductase family protein [Candidatus Defluviibacterium haderslevense]MBK7243030.1 flavin reductase family protein [Candidatus Defluviibacterium haderslevense]